MAVRLKNGVLKFDGVGDFNYGDTIPVNKLSKEALKNFEDLGFIGEIPQKRKPSNTDELERKLDVITRERDESKLNLLECEEALNKSKAQYEDLHSAYEDLKKEYDKLKKK